MHLAVWLQAFDGYAMAAHALDQLSFKAAMAHKHIVQELASSAMAEGRKSLLGVIYDEIARLAVSCLVSLVVLLFLCQA